MKQLFENLGGTIAVALATISWADVEVGLRIASSALSILVAIITLYFSLKAWFKKANSDGVITEEEKKEAIAIVTKSGSEIASAVDDIKKDSDNKEKEGKTK